MVTGVQTCALPIFENNDHKIAKTIIKNTNKKDQWEHSRNIRIQKQRQDTISRVSYARIDPQCPESGGRLAALLDEMDADRPRNRLFYLSVPPAAYIPLVTLLGEAGLARESGGRSARIVVEKPFGRDLSTARELDRVLHRFFAERRIFRIDHYMAKETVQNILLLRFANATTDRKSVV